MQDIFFPHGDHLPLPFYMWVGTVGSDSLQPGMFIHIDRKVLRVSPSYNDPKRCVTVTSKSADGIVYNRDIPKGDPVQIYAPSYEEPLDIEDWNEDSEEDYWDYKCRKEREARQSKDVASENIVES